MRLPTNATAQKNRVLHYLLENPHKGINRFEAAQWLNVIHLATRIKDLKEEWDIYWVDETVNDPYGNPHEGIRRYFVRGRTIKGVENGKGYIQQTAIA